MGGGARNLLLTVVLALVAGAAGAWGGAHWAAGRSHEAHGFHAAVHDDLGLTADQERRIEAAERRYAERRAVLEAEMRRANAALADAIRREKADTAAVQAAVDRSHGIMGELQKATIAHVFEMRAVLTPEQAARFDAEVVEALTHPSR
jgi:Spy/CpxP family protein refolding chaperone